MRPRRKENILIPNSQFPIPYIIRVIREPIRGLKSVERGGLGPFYTVVNKNDLKINHRLHRFSQIKKLLLLVMNYIYKDETYRIIGAAQEVHKELGSGFLEVVYQDALEIEFNNNKIPYKREYALPIYYKNIKMNRVYHSDFLCYNKIIVETKSVNRIVEESYAQTMHYLKATKFKLGLIINFGEPSLKVKRIIL